MGYRTYMQSVSVGNQFDGTLPTTTPGVANDKKTWPVFTAGGKYDFGNSTPQHVVGFEVFALGSDIMAGTRGTVDLVGTTIADTETFTIAGRAYRFMAVPVAIDDVLFDAAEATCMANLIACINGTGTPGTEYFVGSVINPDVTAGALATVTTTLTSKVGGTVANAITTTDTFSAGGFGAATLTGGLDNGTCVLTKVTAEADEIIVYSGTGISQYTLPASNRTLLRENEYFKLVTTNQTMAMGCMISIDRDKEGGTDG
ncbi:MAG: hypothetical protein DRP42_00720 [Tenericutes bacterium]|nr:MAG: hypothetical protein DRP42_00720 [Mycoplasmatota bacterium]